MSENRQLTLEDVRRYIYFGDSNFDEDLDDWTLEHAEPVVYKAMLALGGEYIGRHDGTRYTDAEQMAFDAFANDFLVYAGYDQRQAIMGKVEDQWGKTEPVYDFHLFVSGGGPNIFLGSGFLSDGLGLVRSVEQDYLRWEAAGYPNDEEGPHTVWEGCDISAFPKDKSLQLLALEDVHAEDGTPVLPSSYRWIE